MAKQGKFICIEGIDAGGKTTHAHRLVKNLKNRGFDTIYTTEPTKDKIGKMIKTQILRREKRASSVVEALLFAADRVNHVEREIKPALKEGKIVVSDRYLHSSLAYQGAAGLDLQWIREINKHAILPDLAIYIDVSPEVVIERMRWKKLSVMERLKTQRKVREVYMKLLRKNELVCVEGDRPKQKVEKDILKIVLEFLKI
jgi:dTMP kinase